MQIRNSSLVAAVALGSVLLVTCAIRVGASETPDAEIQELQKQEDALTQELAKVKSGTDLQEQQKAMQSHWSMMQNYMQAILQTPGVAASACIDWTMVGPGMMGQGTTGNGPTCPWGHGIGMMGPGMIGGWALPNQKPGQYQKRMHTLQHNMRKQMTAIAAETDTAKRDVLLRQHYDTVYRNMQTMRGMGWMWDLSAASSFPDASSSGGQLEAKYCSQCHAAPAPSLHTAKEWADVTGRMEEHIGDKVRPGAGVMVPSASDMAAIVEYLDKHARPGT